MKWHLLNLVVVVVVVTLSANKQTEKPETSEQTNKRPAQAGNKIKYFEFSPRTLPLLLLLLHLTSKRKKIELMASIAACALAPPSALAPAPEEATKKERHSFCGASRKRTWKPGGRHAAVCGTCIVDVVCGANFGCGCGRLKM